MRDALCKAFAEGAEDGEDVRNAEDEDDDYEPTPESEAIEFAEGGDD